MSTTPTFLHNTTPCDHCPVLQGIFLPGLCFFIKLVCLTAVPASGSPAGCFVPFSPADPVPWRFIDPLFVRDVFLF